MKKIKLLTIILFIILITAGAFVGVYVPKQNRMENIIKDYSYSMELNGSRNIVLKVSEGKETIIKDAEGKEVTESEKLTDEEIAQKGYKKEEVPHNSADLLNVDNYKNAKNVIEKRLKKLEAENYNIKLNEQTGDIVVELEENDKTDSIISSIATTGKFEIIDTQTNEVLMTNQDIKLSNVMYGSDTAGTIVYLNIEFTKEGAKKYEEITTNYKVSEISEVEDENTETTEENAEQTSEEEENEKTITMKIDNEEIMTTSFDEIIKTGTLQLSVGKATTDQATIQESVTQASSMATVLDSGNMPIRYDVEENKYIESDITKNELEIVGYVIAGITVIGLIVLMIRYKSFGIIGAISYIGLISMFLLIIRYANVILSLEGIFGIVIILILNYIFVNKLLSKLKIMEERKEAIKETYKEFFSNIIPICIMVITFCFMKWLPISSFGMVMFWGIALIAIYHITITNSLLKIKASK